MTAHLMPVAERELTRSRSLTRPRQNWHSYDADDVLNAYMKGKEDGKDELRLLIREKVRENVDLTLGLAESFCQEIAGDLGIDVKGLYVGIADVFELRMLLLVDVEDYVSERMLTAYERAIERESEAKSETLVLRIEFTPRTEDTEERAIVADGFVFKYEPRERE